MHVRSPKTERHKGHESRYVPIVPKLMRLLEQRYEEAPEGVEQIVFARGGALRERMAAAVKRAGGRALEGPVPVPALLL